jgi:hypothetical protein
MSRDEDLKGAELKAWQEEFDRRIADGAKVNKDMGGGFIGLFRNGGNTDRIQGDDGRWHTRRGGGCCGCGRHRDGPSPEMEAIAPGSSAAAGHPNYGKPPVVNDDKPEPAKKPWYNR